MNPGRSIRLLGVAALMAGGATAQTVQPDTNLSPDEQASRFLAQATFGPTTDTIAEVRGLGYDYNAWIDREVAKAPSYATPLAVAAKPPARSPRSPTLTTGAPATR